MIQEFGINLESHCNMLGINEVKNGSLIVFEDAPIQVLLISHSHQGRGGSSSTTKMKNLITGAVVERTFKQADAFEEARVIKTKAEFLYSHRDEFWFKDNDKKARFMLNQDVIGEAKNFLKPATEIIALRFFPTKGKDINEDGMIINIELPVTGDYKVVEAPPAIRGNTSQGGSKVVTIETGAKVTTPLFIEIDDVIRVNTERGEYVKRL